MGCGSGADLILRAALFVCGLAVVSLHPAHGDEEIAVGAKARAEALLDELAAAHAGTKELRAAYEVTFAAGPGAPRQEGRLELIASPELAGVQYRGPGESGPVDFLTLGSAGRVSISPSGSQGPAVSDFAWAHRLVTRLAKRTGVRPEVLDAAMQGAMSLRWQPSLEINPRDDGPGLRWNLAVVSPGRPAWLQRARRLGLKGIDEAAGLVTFASAAETLVLHRNTGWFQRWTLEREDTGYRMDVHEVQPRTSVATWHALASVEATRAALRRTYWSVAELSAVLGLLASRSEAAGVPDAERVSVARLLGAASGVYASIGEEASEPPGEHDWCAGLVARWRAKGLAADVVDRLVEAWGEGFRLIRNPAGAAPALEESPGSSATESK